MARISRRKERVSDEKKISQQDRIYKVAAYARLSSDQDEKKNESIDVQIDIIKKYVEKQNLLGEDQMILYDTYCDSGKTGTNFNRDEFLRMMRDIRVGDVNCVIVKDFSRFGRNYLEAGNYIEKIFPFLGVRFIAVTDKFDTMTVGNDSKNMAMNIKNLVNDMYAKDFSKRAKIHLQQRRERGSYVGGATPYGFTFEWVGKNKKLIVDKNTASIVSMIFDTFIREKKYSAVTNKLNEMRINPPMIYKVAGEVYCREEESYKGWDNASVKRILKNITYIGTLAQGKDKPVVFENAHEAIISKQNYEEVQKIMNIKESEKKKKNSADLIPLEENVYDGVLFCGSCGRKLTRHSCVQEYRDGNTTRIESYDCLNTYSSKSGIKCESNRISKQMLSDIILASLRMEFALYLEKPKTFIKHNERKAEEYRGKYQAEINKIDKQIDYMEEMESILYMKYRSGELPQEKYVNVKLDYADKNVLLNEKKKELEERLQNLFKFVDKQNRAIRSLGKIKNGLRPLGKEFSREFVNSLIEKIYVYPGKRVEIIYAFTNEMMEGVH